ncbi:MAG: enoyl-CoA hydratase [endosymbiont of Escarpia spicata]|uniref:Enoyl-CoA hydratase n=1 Tax=endosymbiont of Escarpia spicata TaxID=2200908 RepID=A0A370DT80_9GAMM|nr:MAG: enoyl-CoA hydratase [endosymbiont of Escarpia spicata]
MNKLQSQIRLNNSFDHVEVKYEPEYNAVWAKLQYPGRPCMSKGLLDDVARAQQLIRESASYGHNTGDENRLRYQVLSSATPGVFNLGGDLAHFIDLIERKDRESLMAYAKSCIDILYPSSIGYGLPFTTISLVQGEALGGGFEAALSTNVLIAEESATFGFPETVFGLFPGMGAFSFLARRMAPALAKRVIASGKVYTAWELHEMGLVDVVAPDGKGEEAVNSYIKHQQNRSAGFVCLDKIMDQFNPVTYEELMKITTMWVDAAMGLSKKNLRLMDYLLRAQERRWGVKEDLMCQAVG